MQSRSSGFLSALFIGASLTVSAQKPLLVELVSKDKKVDVIVGGKPFTSYFYPGEEILKKPVLYPVYSPKGHLVTRGWPLDPRPGERIDHPHHVGIWFNYEDVNGYDYWNNSNTPPNPKAKYGTIRHTGIKAKKDGKRAELTVTADWIEDNGKGKKVIAEQTTYFFYGTENQRIIDRITTLKALEDVHFKDVKDGMFAIRVARQLELPSTKAEVYTDANGVVTNVPKLDNTGVTGNYRSSEGVEGVKVWATRGRWMNLSGKIDGEAVSIALIDHPRNVGYPTYWHARDYGLFALNPLGQAVFSNGKETLNLKLKKGEAKVFRYRVVVSSGKVTDTELNKLADAFAK
ncbi:MAG: PmoA family protein [Siphonobacter sp.]